jgi:hypothetical protein
MGCSSLASPVLEAILFDDGVVHLDGLAQVESSQMEPSRPSDEGSIVDDCCCNIPRFNYCNRTLIMDVIPRLNIIGTKSIKFFLNSKSRIELQFSFEFHLPLVKVSNTKVVPNTLIYLKKFFHIFLRSLIIFPNF